MDEIYCCLSGKESKLRLNQEKKDCKEVTTKYWSQGVRSGASRQKTRDRPRSQTAVGPRYVQVSRIHKISYILEPVIDRRSYKNQIVGIELTLETLSLCGLIHLAFAKIDI